VNIIGVSKDSVASHLQFAERNELKIKLLQDFDGTLLKEF
jgi:peroxiredoxin